MFSKSFRQIFKTMKTSRLRYAAIFAALVLVLVIGAVQASGPRRPPQPPGPPQGGMWGMKMPNWMPWYPMEPTPTIKIIAVSEDDWAAFETSDFPEDQDFVVTMGKMYTRGVNGVEVGQFNSGDGSAQQMRFPIPEEFYGQKRIAIRAQTDHMYPYFAFNWFYNTTAEVETGSAVEMVDLVKEAVVDEAETESAEAPEEAEAAGEAEAPVEGEEAAEAEVPAEGEEGVGGAEDEQAAMPSDSNLTGVTWQWTEFNDAVQGSLPIDNPEQYTIEFMPEGLVGVKADCNNGSGTYIADDEGGIDIAIGAVTLALCAPESLSDQFLQNLNDAAIYSFTEGDLLLDLPLDSGTLRFTAAGAEAPAEEAEAETPAEGETAEVPAEGEDTAAEEEAAASSVTGTVTYLQRIALPDDAVVTVRLQDTSRADAAAFLIAEQVIETAGQQVPIPYEVEFNPDSIKENFTYTMSARIEDAEGNLLFINDTAIPVITNDNPTEDVEIMTVPVASDESTDAEAEAPAEGEAEAPAEGEAETPAEDEEAETPMEGETTLTGVAWNWTEFSDPVQGVLAIDTPEDYSVAFLEDGTVGIRADCNNGSGSFVADEEGGIDITVGAVTLALCDEDSLSDQFLQYLDAATIYFFEEGDLYMDLPVDSGTLRFAAGGTPETKVTTTASRLAVPVFGGGNGESQNGVDHEGYGVPSFKICSVIKDEVVYIITEDFPADQEFTVKMGVAPAYPAMQHRPMKPHPMPMPMPNGQGPQRPGTMSYQKMWPQPAPKVWIPYYEAGTLETGDGGELEAKFEIPSELAGAYRISIMMRTDHQFPYYSYNWFYNNSADVCNGQDVK